MTKKRVFNTGDRVEVRGYGLRNKSGAHRWNGTGTIIDKSTYSSIYYVKFDRDPKDYPDGTMAEGGFAPDYIFPFKGKAIAGVTYD